ncbi:endogenous retrovirus group K member 9 Env polyprotein-like [Arvicanthis niloticus]|uniref:endogenous retrovirus group K member 9 Env polyprotein-like n=1 Tax=Arvicanthis niloticus TaxID=61156 RepID=UPI00402B074C
MMLDPKADTVMRKGPFLQGHKMNPFHKWLLCGINSSCTALNPLVFLQGGAAGRTSIMEVINETMVKQEGDQAPQLTDETQLVTGVNKTLINQTDFLPIPVSVYPPFLFILSNNSFIDCTNETCEMSPCWDTQRASWAMVARVPRWIPIPVETPSTLSLFQQKIDFGVTAAIVTAISLAAAAATAAGFAMATTVQTSTTLNQLSATVTEAMNTHASATAQLKGGLMVVNQRLDLVEERLDILFQLAQLGCERKLGGVCITSAQYENLTRAANLSRKLSLYLIGNWSKGFVETMESLRAAIVNINATQVDLSLTEGFSSWISSAFSFFKEWVGVGLFGVALCCGLVFMLWLVCKLKAQQKHDKALISQALLAMEQGANPAVWLSRLRKN